MGTPTAELRTIYIVQRGWHTGVLVPLADWPNKRWRLLEDFATVEFLEFGWGDERFYQAQKGTFALAVRAALWPTPSVVHVIGLNGAREADAGADQVVAVRVTARGLRALTTGIEQAFADEEPTSDGSGDSAISSAPRPNRFYEARMPFYFPRMCNWWIARRLEDAGCPIRAWSVVTANQVIHEARGFSQ